MQKRYMVYLTQAQSTRNYDTWLCGGAIIHRWFILTSAACVEDVQNMYAIAGYEKYIIPKDLNIDKCTKNTKKRIVFTCVPEAYNLTYSKVEKWSKLDIAIVKVDRPYIFNDQSYIEYCSYIPKKIDINFDEKYQAANKDVIVLGWGHTSVWREFKDKTDYNHKTLLYASTLIYAKKECTEFFKNPDLGDLIDKYMICTLGEGDIDDQGRSLDFKKRRYFNNVDKTQLVNAREESLDSTEKKIVQNLTSSFLTLNVTRRQGICQNDHGGPLVTWVEGKELVIGVASLFRLNEKSECIPPFLYTSTAHNKLFIECVLNTEKKVLRSSICDEAASEKGFNIVRRYISWTSHYDKNKSDEINIRPQIPIHHFQGRNK